MPIAFFNFLIVLRISVRDFCDSQTQVSSKPRLLLCINTMATSFGDSTVQHARQELTSEDKKFAAVHLNETDETRENAVAEIKCWIQESDDLPARIDDFLILRFLRVCKYDLEKTKDKIRNYYKHRSELSEWYTIKDVFQPKLQEFLDLGTCLPLRKPDSKGRIVILVRATRHNPNIHEVSNLIKISTLMLEMAIKYYPAGSVYGCVWYLDGSNPTARHIIQLSPQVLKNLAHALQSCYPIRYQKIVFFNVPTIFEMIMSIFRSFMTVKLKNRFYVYSHQLCFENIPADALPVEYGGTGGTMQELTEYWKKYIEDNRNWITEDENKNENMEDQTAQMAELAEDFQQTYL